MANPWRGEVAIAIGGKPYLMRLSFGALAELEAALGTTSLTALVDRFETGAYSVRDLVALLAAGLKGAGNPVDPETLLAEGVDGGPIEAARKAGQLLRLTFIGPEAAPGGAPTGDNAP